MKDDRALDPAIWGRLEALWRAAVTLTEPGEAVVVNAPAVDDTQLAAELESLLSCVPDAQEFFRQLAGAVDDAAKCLGAPGSDEADQLEQLRLALAARYIIEGEVGRGGMSIVYRARDLKHSRHVALKVLKAELGALLGVDRFLSEIKVTAHLQHPHLLPLFDSGDVDGQLFYVMPFIEGMSLRARLEREKQLPVDEAIRITVAIAGALDYAHRHNVVHRDLKPENILLHEGEPLVSDFGIAVAVSKAGGPRLTQTGFSVGTPQYMSPEQASGDRTIDARSDIYSLAAMLYELLAGETPHSGPTVQAIVARVLTDPPRNVRALRPTVPLHVDAALQKALSKLPADRFSSAQQFVDALLNPGTQIGHAIAGDGRGIASGKVRPIRLRTLLPWLAAAAVTVVVLQMRKPQQAETPEAQFPLTLPAGVTLPLSRLTPAAVSPDGRTIAFLGDSAGISRLYVRALAELTSKPLPGTEGAVSVFFSWDGASIGFFADGRIKRVPVTGGSPANITTFISQGGGASWGRNDVIVFTHGGAGLWRVSAHGGEAQQLNIAGSLPSFLPDGRRFFFMRRDSIMLGSLDGSVRNLGVLGRRPMYVDGDYLLFSSGEGNLLAAPFDLRRGRVTGSPRVVLENIRAVMNTGTWNVATNGTLVANLGGNTTRLVKVDRNGFIQRLSEEVRRFHGPRISPDGNRIAVEVSPSGSGSITDIWIFDRSAGTLTPFTSGGGISPVWTPDGKRLTWVKPGANPDVVWQASDGSGAVERIASGQPTSWAPDGHTLLLNETPERGKEQISVVEVPGKSAPLVTSPEFTNRMGRISPDGRWLAYYSIESGRWEVYARPFRRPGGKVMISSNGGSGPVWSHTGLGLFYTGEGGLVAASLGTSSGITVLSRKVVFDGFSMGDFPPNFDVLPGDSGFIMLQPAGPPAQLSVVVNLIDRLRHK